MSNLEELIAELCPDGVEFCMLSEIATYAKERIPSNVVNQDNYVSVENLLQNKQGKTTATSVPAEGVVIKFSAENILIGNIRPYLRKIWLADCDGGTNGDVLAIQIIEKQRIDPKYLFYVLSSEDFFLYDIQNSKGAKMPRGSKDAVMKYRLPVPPLLVQREIVRIFDSFTELIAELSTESSYRKSVFEEVVDSYFESKVRGEVIKLKYVTKNESRRNKDHSIEAAYSITQRGLIPTTEYFGDTKITSEDTSGYKVVEPGWFVYSPSRIDVGSVNFHRGKDSVIVSPLNIVFSVDRSKLIEEYLLYYLKSHSGMFQILSRRIGIEGTGRKLLPYDSFSEIEITLPTICEQIAVVKRFDTFKQYSSALENEISARQKQFEYYRNKLLTFKARKAKE